MRFPHVLFLVLASSPALLEASSSRQPARRSYNTHEYYVIHHDPAHGVSPEESAAALGTELVEQVGELENHFLVRTKRRSLLERRDEVVAHEDSEDDSDDAVVASLQTIRSRGDHHSRAVRSLERQALRRRAKRAVIPHPAHAFPGVDDIREAVGIRDPLFSSQWHIINEDHPEHMMNVTGLWREGVTGKGVISGLIDDGIDYESDDLAANFYKEGSYDFNDHEPLPKPKLDDDKHGTRCAGEIAAIKNDVCGVGLAYDSKVAGLRILSGPISDADESIALNYGFQETSIYSCSWGPPDDGRHMEGPNLLIRKAVLNGINKGRGGKGSVFVFASGNGASHGDACNFDGYTNSIYSVTVGAIDHKGKHPYYSEACAANMVVAYSSGDRHWIETTDVGKNTCSHRHGGTSAAAPLAVGVFALALSVRPDLTWRDIQHLCVYSAAMVDPEDPDWEKTSTGRPFSYKFGFGKLDAYAYVTMARNWKLVKPQAWMEISTIELAGATMVGKVMKGGEPIGPEGVESSTMVTRDMLEDWNLEKLEHITIKVWIRHSRRGDVEVELVSPAGIKSVLATMRERDDVNTGFVGWTFMTLKHWDENPVGKWTLRVSDQDNEEEGAFLGWSMTMWGSAIDPSIVEKFSLDDDPNEGHNLPPHPSDHVPTTKHHPKPTAHLPEEHASPSVTPTPTPAPSKPAADKSILWNMFDLVFSNKGLFSAFGLLFIVAAIGLFCCVRRRRGPAYKPIPDAESVPLHSMGREGATPGAPGSGERSASAARELRDGFGIGSDDEEEVEAGERSALTGGGRRANAASYHDDDAPTTARLVPYRDEPVAAAAAAAAASSPPREGSDDDGSWQDATAVDHDAALSRG